VLSSCEDHEVLWGVVERVEVDVVDDLVPSEHTPLTLFNNHPVKRSLLMSRTGFDGDRVWWVTRSLLRA
jgi:hypothetical protein